jgi:hypothetical protein
MDEATRIALANTENGRVTAQFMANTVAQAAGVKPEQVAGLFPNAPQAGAVFAGAASGVAPAAEVSRGMQVEGQRVAVTPQRAPS